MKIVLSISKYPLYLALVIGLSSCASYSPEMDDPKRPKGPRLVTLPIALLTMGMIGDSGYEQERKEKAAIKEILEQDKKLIDTANLANEITKKVTFGKFGDEEELLTQKDIPSDIDKIDNEILSQLEAVEVRDLVSMSEDSPMHVLEYGKSSYQEVVEVLGYPKMSKITADGNKESEFKLQGFNLASRIISKFKNPEVLILKFDKDEVLKPVSEHKGLALDERKI